MHASSATSDTKKEVLGSQSQGLNCLRVVKRLRSGIFNLCCHLFVYNDVYIERPSVLHPCPAEEIIRLPYSVKHSDTTLELIRDGKESRFLVMPALEKIQLQVLLLRMPSIATSQTNSSPSQM